MEDKNRNKKERRIENSNKYGREQSDYIKITLNVKQLSMPTKTQGLSGWIKTQDPTIYCPKETQFEYRNTCGLEVNGWRKI